MEDTLGDVIRLIAAIPMLAVLILVLMEDTLGVQWKRRMLSRV